VIPSVDYESKSYLPPGGTNLLMMEILPWPLTLRIRCHRLGKLRISKNGHDSIGIDSTNVQQFTMDWRNSLPGVVDVEGQVVKRESGETFVRFSRDTENIWRVCRALHSSAAL